MPTLRDKFWLWGHSANAHFGEYNIVQRSRMTPAEAAFYLGVPNLFMVQYYSQPAPPLDQLAISLSPLRQVVWSVVGGMGETSASNRDAVFDTATRFPNITGVVLDDFFPARPRADGRPAVLTLDELREVRTRLHLAGQHARRLDLWVVLYDNQLDLPVHEYLALVDKLTLWTWRAKNLLALEQRFDQAQRLAPQAKRVLGCYMYDYGDSCQMTVDQVAMQCDLGLRWLKEGRIDGMIFHSSCICDLNFEAVEWTRRWIAQHGDTAL